MSPDIQNDNKSYESVIQSLKKSNLLNYGGDQEFIKNQNREMFMLQDVAKHKFKRDYFLNKFDILPAYKERQTQTLKVLSMPKLPSLHERHR